MKRKNYFDIYESYEHYPIAQADKDIKKSLNTWYRVTTINGTFATENEKQNHSKVHKNVYKWTLEELIDFIQSMGEFWEDILSIEKVESGR